MAAAPPEKTVHFYTLYSLQKGARVDPTDPRWVATLGPTLHMSPTEMAVDGVIYDPRKTNNGRFALGMHKPINPAFMSQISADGTVEDLLPSDPNTGRVAHSSAVVFLNDLSAIAIAKGNPSAPGLDALTDFLNQFAPLNGGTWKHQALMDPAKLKRFEEAEGVTKFQAKFSTVKDLFTERESGILDLGDEIATRLGADVEVRIEVRTQPEAPLTAMQRMLTQVRMALGRLAVDRGTGAKVNAVFPDGLTEELNLVATHLAVTAPLPEAASERATFADLVNLVADVVASQEDEIRQRRRRGE